MSLQPDLKIVIEIQRQEINRLNDNRIYLMAMLEAKQQEIEALTKESPPEEPQ